MIKNKKSQQLALHILTALLVSVAAAFIISSALTKTHAASKDFGDVQISMLDSFSNAERSLFFIDQAAEYSSINAVYGLGKEGFRNNICGKYLGYSLWKTKEGDGCIDGNMIEENLKLILNDNLNDYLKKYLDIEIPVDNYDYLIEDHLTITGFAVSNLDIPIGSAGIETDIEEIFEINQNKEGGLEIEPFQPSANIDVSIKYRLTGYNRPKNAVVDRIILHHTGDNSAETTVNTLRRRGLMVHYIIDKDGTIYNTVEERKIAFHAKGWNSRSIGIEIVNLARIDTLYTDAQYESIKRLIQDIASRWPSIEVDNEHVVGHYEVSTSGKWDPSPTFEWSKIGLPRHILLADLGKRAPEDFGYA